MRSPSPRSRLRSASSRLSGWFSRSRDHAARSNSTNGDGTPGVVRLVPLTGCATCAIVSDGRHEGGVGRSPSREDRSPRVVAMCGIVGYVGRSTDGTALEVVMEGLARLEYRGYDSAGVALVAADHVETR